jgi:hypothetical protein
MGRKMTWTIPWPGGLYLEDRCDDRHVHGGWVCDDLRSEGPLGEGRLREVTPQERGEGERELEGERAREGVGERKRY